MAATIWNDMFHPGLPILEMILRPALVYIFLVAALRVAGKRELAQLNPFDLVVLLTLSNAVQNAIIGEDHSVLGGLVGATTLLTLNYVVVRFLYSHERLDRLVEGDLEVLVDKGAVDHACMKRNLITNAELEAAAHRQGFDSIAEVERAVLERGGVFSFVRRETSPELAHYRELLGRLDQLSSDIAGLRGGQTPH